VQQSVSVLKRMMRGVDVASETSVRP